MSEKTPQKPKKDKYVNIELSLTAKNAINTGILTDKSQYKDWDSSLYIQKDGEQDGEIYDFKVTSLEKPPYSLSELRIMYAENGGNVEEIDKVIRSYIIDNAHNNDKLAGFLGQLALNLGEELYDPEMEYKNHGNSAIEMLSGILSVPEGEYKKGFVCTNIAEIFERYLHECNIEAVVLSGKKNETHSALLYKNGDGKYTYINYGSVKEVYAPTIKEAALLIGKSSHDMISKGMISFITEDGSYQEFAFQDEAVWGKMLDKRAYNDKSLFDRGLSKKDGIDVKLDYSSQGGVSAEVGVTNVYSNDHHFGNTTIALGYKKNNETANFNSSQSLGVKLGLNQINKNGTYFKLSGVADYTLGKINGRYMAPDYLYSKDSYVASVEKQTATLKEQGYTDSEIREAISDNAANFDIPPFGYISNDIKTNYLTTFARAEGGLEQNVFTNEKTNLQNTTQISLTGNYTLGFQKKGKSSHAGDLRFAIEDGLQLNSNIGNTTLSNEISGGILLDYKYTLGAQKPGSEIGSKFNASTSFYTCPSENLSYGAEISGYSVFTKPTTDYGVRTNTFVSYKPSTTSTTFIGQAGVKFDYQKFHLGGFNELTENNTSLNISLEAQNKKNTFSVGYNGKFNNICSKRNESTFFVGYRRTF